MPREVVLARDSTKPLTARELAAIERRGVPEGADRLRVNDTEVRGLHLRLSRTGARSWAVTKKVNGRVRRFTIPNSERMTLAEARRAAIALLADLARGRDPVAERRARREQARREALERKPTLRDLLDRFEALVAQPQQQKSWSERRVHIEREYRRFLDMPADRITPGHIRDVLDAAVARGARISGVHGYRYLRRVFRWAVRRGLVPSDPTEPLTETVKQDMGRERMRTRVLSPAEIARLWRVWEAEPHNAYSGALRIMLLTGARRDEVASMRWCDLDLARREWRQPTNKSDRPHVVPLSDEAIRVIHQMPERGEYVFASAAGRPIVGNRGNWDRVCKRYAHLADVYGWTRHDLRRTAATLLAAMKVERTVVELLLNNSERSAKGGMVAATYDRHSYALEKRQAVERLARRIREIVEGAEAEVVAVTGSGDAEVAGCP